MNITVNEFILYSFIPFRKTRNKKTLGKKAKPALEKGGAFPVHVDRRRELTQLGKKNV